MGWYAARCSMDLDIPADNWAARLALETAMGYYDRDELFARSGLTREVYESVTTAPEFKLAVTEYKRELHSGPSPLKTKATRMLWDSIGNLKMIASDADVAPADRIAAIREIAKLAGALVETPAATATATIQIVRFSDGDAKVVN